MARKRRGGKQSAKPAHTTPAETRPLAEVNGEKEPTSHPSALWIVVDVVSVATLIGWLLWAYTMNSMKLTPPPVPVQYFVAGAFGVSIALHNFVLPQLALTREYEGDTRVARFVHSADRVASFLSATALILAMVFATGADVALAALFQQRFDGLSPKTSEYLTVAIGMVVSGVVGNAAYDLLKKAWRRIKAPAAK